MPTEEETPETPGSEPSDDDILAEMAEERQKKGDDKLLGDEEKPKGAKTTKKKDSEADGKARPKASESAASDEEEDDDSDPEDDELDEDEDDAPQSGKRAKAVERFKKGDIKGALKLALGLKDDDFGDDKWEDPKFANAKFRVFRNKVEKAETEAKAREAKHAEREAKFTDYVKGLGVKLQPAFNLMKLRTEYQQTRDPAIVVQIVEDFTEEGYDIVQKRVLKGEKAPQADRRLLSKLEQLQNELAELKKPKEETPEEKLAKAQEQLKEYISEIKEEIAEHDVRKIPGAAKKVYAMLRKHYDPALKGPRISIEKAADRVLKLHLRTLARLRPESAEPPPKKPAKVFAHSRTETREAAVTDDDPSDDDILRQMEIERAQRRRDEAKKAKAGKK